MLTVSVSFTVCLPVCVSVSPTITTTTTITTTMIDHNDIDGAGGGVDDDNSIVIMRTHSGVLMITMYSTLNNSTHLVCICSLYTYTFTRTHDEVERANMHRQTHI